VRVVIELAQLGQSSISLAGVAFLLLTYNRLLAALSVVFVSLRYSSYALLAKTCHSYQL